jgi:hypothetical protein
VNQSLVQLRKSTDALQRLIRAKRGQVGSEKVRNIVRDFVHGYFGQMRKALLATNTRESDFVAIDSCAQDLLRCAQHRTLATRYLEILKEMNAAISELELASVSSYAPNRPAVTFDGSHRRILETLSKVCPPAAASFEQGLRDLSGPERISWRGTAVEFREALRELLDSIAPDEAVTGQTGYKQEPDTKGPTMKQKAVFVLRSRRPKDPQVKAFVDAVNVVEELIGKLVRSVYTRSSLSVHIQMTRDEARQIRNYVSLVLMELLEIKE